MAIGDGALLGGGKPWSDSLLFAHLHRHIDIDLEQLIEQSFTSCDCASLKYPEEVHPDHHRVPPSPV